MDKAYLLMFWVSVMIVFFVQVSLEIRNRRR